MSIRDPLRADSFKYRKRSTISIYGSVQGLHVARYRPGLAERSSHQSGQLVRSAVRYDPWSPRYDTGSTGYQPVDPWFEGLHVPRTPMIRWRGQARPTESVLPVNHLASDDLSEQWVEELQIGDGTPESVDPHTPLDQMEVGQKETGGMQSDPLAEIANAPVDDLQQLAERLLIFE